VQLNPVIRQPRGLKDLHGAIDWALSELEGAKGRSAVILFTDGRDGRLAPSWFMNDRGEEIFDPLFGLADEGESAEFLELLEAVRGSGARLYFLSGRTDRPPDFAGRPISGLFPGAKEAVADYHSRVRLRMERFAEASDGFVFYGNGPETAVAQFQLLYDILFLGSRYSLMYEPAAGDAPGKIEVRMRDPGLRVYHFDIQR
jgi:hypothetical protein